MSTRAEIRERFREENPELDERVVSDNVLNSWAKTANREVCIFTRCIVTNVPETFNTVANTQYYDMGAEIDNFLDIDDSPGGGVYYNDKNLKKSSPAEENQISRKWLSRTAGTPKRWWMQGKYLWFDRKPDAADDVDVFAVLLPNDFDADGEMPFNELGYLQGFDDAINKYMQVRAKAKIGKTDESAIARKDYTDYLKWMKSEVRSMKAAAIQMRPKSYPSRY